MTRTDTVYLDAVTVALCLGSTGPGGHDLRGHLTLSVAVSKGEKKKEEAGGVGFKDSYPSNSVCGSGFRLFHLCSCTVGD